MARLEDLRTNFTSLNWPDKLEFIKEYRTKRHNDLNAVQEFDLSKSKTKSTKVREKKETIKRIPKAKMLALSPEQLALLKQLGIG